MKRALAILLLGSLSLSGQAQTSGALEVCFNYGCTSHWPVSFDSGRLAGVVQSLNRAANAEEERSRLALAIGQLYSMAAEQTPIGADKGGNYADENVFGRMDCIDHSTTTTRFLQLLERQGGLRWHHVLAPARRVRGMIFQHYAAVIEELPGRDGEMESDTAVGPRYVVDSWFVDNGKPAVILPLDAWMQGEGPNV